MGFRKDNSSTSHVDGILLRKEKIEAILNMVPLTTIKEVQRLNGKVEALSRFLSRSANKCRPFFQLLNSSKDQVVWTKE